MRIKYILIVLDNMIKFFMAHVTIVMSISVTLNYRYLLIGYRIYLAPSTSYDCSLRFLICYHNSVNEINTINLASFI